MSDIRAIRAALAAILADIDGINAASGYPPDNVGALPVGFVGLSDVAISYSAGLKENRYTLQAIVLLSRTAGMLDANLASLEVIQTAFETAMLANSRLGGIVNFCIVERIVQDTVDIGQVPYAGFIATLDVTDKYGVSFSG